MPGRPLQWVKLGIADLNTVLGNWNQSVTPGDLTQGDPSNDGFVGIEDLNTVLGNWNTGAPPQVSAIARSASSAGETAEASASSSTQDSVSTNADRRTRRARLSSQADDKPHTHTPGIAVISAWNSLNQRSEHQTHAGYVPRPLQQREKTPPVGLWEDNI